MRFILAIVFFVLCFAVIAIKTEDVLISWTLISDPDQITFERSDTKLLLLWLVVGAAVISFFVWPESFQPQPQISRGQCLSLGLAAAGILAGFQAVTGGDYLGAAERHGVANGYVRCSDETDILMGDLEMARTEQLCETLQT